MNVTQHERIGMDRTKMSNARDKKKRVGYLALVHKFHDL